jgi:hypothetical protein
MIRSTNTSYSNNEQIIYSDQVFLRSIFYQIKQKRQTVAEIALPGRVITVMLDGLNETDRPLRADGKGAGGE